MSENKNLPATAYALASEGKALQPPTRKPLVSIGMPVYNGGDAVRSALSSLLAQSYPEIELIISDNASHDRTRDICEEFARTDSRVSYHRNVNNIGVCGNFAKVLTLADGEYFMWAAHDDRWDPEYVAANLAVLEADPECVGSVSQVIMSPPCPEGESGGGTFPLVADKRENIARYLAHPGMNSRVYGLFRTRILRAAFREAEYRLWGGDWLLIIRLLEHGTMREVPRPLLQRRHNYASISSIAASHRHIIGTRAARFIPLASFTWRVLADRSIPKTTSVLTSLLRHNITHTYHGIRGVLYEATHRRGS